MQTLLTVDQMQRCSQLQLYFLRPMPRSKPLTRYQWVQKNTVISDLSRLQRCHSTSKDPLKHEDVSTATSASQQTTSSTKGVHENHNLLSNLVMKQARMRSAVIKLRNAKKTLRNRVETLRRRLHAMTMERDAVLQAWSNAVSSVDFGLECVFANDMTHDQYSNLRNLLANEYDEGNGRHKRKKMMLVEGKYFEIFTFG